VTKIVVQGDRVLVGLQIEGRSDPEARIGETNRWQILTVHHGRIADIRGFESRSDAQRSL
jgi:hypothetical protein